MNKSVLFIAIFCLSTMLCRAQLTAASSIGEQNRVPFTAVYNYRVEIGDYDSLSFESYYNHYEQQYVDPMDNEIDNYSNKIINHKSIKSWTTHDKTELSKWIHSSFETPYKYFPSIYPCDWTRKLKAKLISSRTFRDFVFAQGCEYAVKCCEKYPKDFQQAVENELLMLIEFSDEMAAGKYEIVQYNYNGYVGDEICFNGKYIDCYDLGIAKSWILRRHFLDSISISEIREKLNTLLTKVRLVDTSNQKDIMYTVLINNEIMLCYGCTGNYMISKSTGKTFPYKDLRYAEKLSFKDEKYRIDYYRKGDFVVLDKDLVVLIDNRHR